MRLIRIEISKFIEDNFLINLIDYNTDEIIEQDTPFYDILFGNEYRVVEISWSSKTETLPSSPNGFRAITRQALLNKKALAGLWEESYSATNSARTAELTAGYSMIRRFQKLVELHSAALSILVDKTFGVKHHEFTGLI